MESIGTLLNQAAGLGAGLGAGREMWVLGLLDESMGGAAIRVYSQDICGSACSIAVLCEISYLQQQGACYESQ